MIKIFLDESYLPLGDTKRFIFATVSIFEDNWNIFHHLAINARKQRKNRWLGEIENLLEDSKGLARINYADVPSNILEVGERDSYVDAKNIGRSDNIWSWCVAYSVMIMMARLLKYGVQFDEAQIFYHRKDLKGDHRKSLENSVINMVSNMIRDNQQVLGYSGTPKVTAFIQVSDPEKGTPASPDQNGVWISDHLCWSFRKLGEKIPMKRLEVGSITNDVLETFNRMKETEIKS